MLHPATLLKNSVANNNYFDLHEFYLENLLNVQAGILK